MVPKLGNYRMAQRLMWDQIVQMVDQLYKFSIKDQLRLGIDDMIIKYEIDLEIKQVFYIKDSGYKDNGFVINLEDAGNENNIQLK